MKIHKSLRQILILVLVVISAILPVSPIFAVTTADITVTATGQFVSFTSNASDYNFGTVATGSVTNTTANWALITNTSSVATNITAKMVAATWTSAGTGWTHSDSAAGANTAAMKIATGNTTTWISTAFITSAGGTLINNLAANTNYVTGISLLAPTSFTDGFSNNNTIRLTMVAS